jgi:hypothetical protein
VARIERGCLPHHVRWQSPLRAAGDRYRCPTAVSPQPGRAYAGLKRIGGPDAGECMTLEEPTVFISASSDMTEEVSAVQEAVRRCQVYGLGTSNGCIVVADCRGVQTTILTQFLSKVV